MSAADVALDLAVAARYPRLPGLAALLDPAVLTERLAVPFTGLDRLRIKPASARVAAIGADGRWWVAHAYDDANWAHKGAKDVARADGAALVDPGRRLVAVPVADDRDVRRIRCWRPDEDVAPSSRAIAAVTSGRRDLVRPHARWRTGTVSHNPARRWVGSVHSDGRPVAAVKVYADRRHAGHAPALAPTVAALGVGVATPTLVDGSPATQLAPWMSGRLPGPGDEDAIAGLLARLATVDAGGVPVADPAGAVDLAPALRAAVATLRRLDPHWGRRADAIAAAVRVPLEAMPVDTFVHGDLSADQVVIGCDGEPVVLDLDRSGRGRRGWDAATWHAAAIGRPAGATDPGVGVASPPPVLLAAAAILRAPEPFRRRRPGRVAATERLLRAAEVAVDAAERSRR